MPAVTGGGISVGATTLRVRRLTRRTDEEDISIHLSVCYYDSLGEVDTTVQRIILHALHAVK
jgi:hypothetical protein